MTAVIATKGISHAIDDIISRAQEYIILVSPFIRISHSFLDRLQVASNRGISITLVYGKKKLTKIQEDKIYKLRNCRVLFNENLHAKAFINESKGVIASMNLYETSEHYNYELGVQFLKDDDNELHENTLQEINHIIECSEVKREANTLQGKELEEEHTETILNTKSKLKIVDYPLKGITITKDYGFVTYCLKEYCSMSKKQWEKLKRDLSIELDGYRVYCKSLKESKIYIYPSKDIIFKNSHEARKYKKLGIQKSLEIFCVNLKSDCQ